MKKIIGFSLAEALITLLIVCIIAIATAPLITKKTKKTANNTNIWAVDTTVKNAIAPLGGMNIRLGEISPTKSSSIVVTGKMNFVNRQGETIGWIDENGNSSFTETNQATYQQVMANQQRIMETLNTLNNMINSPKNNMQQSRDHSRTRNDYNRNNYNSNSNSNSNDTDLQRQLNELLKNMNTNR